MKDSNKNGARYERLGRILAMASGMEPSVGQCPTPEQLAALMDRGLAGSERDTVLGHLAGCERCRETLITAVRLSAADETGKATQGWRFGFLVPYAAAAVVLIAVVSAALVYRSHMAPTDVQVARQYAPAVVNKNETPVAASPEEQAPATPGNHEEQKAKAPSAPAPAPAKDNLRLSDMPAGGAKSDGGYTLKENAAPPAKAGNIEKKQPARRAAPPSGSSEPARGMMGFSEPSAGDEDRFIPETPLPSAQQAPRTFAEPEETPAPAGLTAAPTELAKPEAQSEVVRARGVIISLDLEKGELDFLPEGEKEKVPILVDPSLLKGLHPGDKVLVVYDKSKTNIATRIKKQRAIIMLIGC